MSDEIAKCGLCGQPMPPDEQMFKYHGFSGPCPIPKAPKSNDTKTGEAPVKPGYYWAKWRIPAEGTHEGTDMCPSDTWEIVQVNDNNSTGDEALSVSIPGVRETQWPDCFVWGEFVAPLKA